MTRIDSMSGPSPRVDQPVSHVGMSDSAQGTLILMGGAVEPHNEAFQQFLRLIDARGGARIVCLADSIEVMSSRQLYRKPLTPEEIVEELQRCRGTQFDPEIVDLALGLIEAGELVLSVEGMRVLEREPETTVGDDLALQVQRALDGAA